MAKRKGSTMLTGHSLESSGRKAREPSKNKIIRPTQQSEATSAATIDTRTTSFHRIET